MLFVCPLIPLYSFRPVVIKVEPAEEFRWRGRLMIPGLFAGEHVFRLEKQVTGTVRFSHCEYFQGILVPLLGSLLSKTKRGFEAMNNALRQRAESNL